MVIFTSQKLAEYFKLKVPSDHWLTQTFGNVAPMYTNWGWKGHNGDDYGGDLAKVFAPFNGDVHKVRKTDNKADPWWISIWSDQEVTIDGQRVRLQCTYIHCDEFYVNEGDHVVEQQHIARTDNTGYPNFSTGPHLYFGVYPLYWTGLSWQTDALNGYDGAVDPQPLFSDFVFDLDKFPEGQLIKQLNDPKVYIMDGRKRRWFVSQGSFWLSGRAFKTSDIWQLPSFEMAKIPLGEPMPDLPPAVKAEMASLYPNFLK
jgi:murein DD-endopeptidase MepM/ murein hydrolase activator NlpD